MQTRREKISTKADTSLRSNTTTSRTVFSFAMYVEKLSRKRESEKIHTVFGFAWVPLVEIYLQESVAAFAGYGESCKHVSALLHYVEYEVRVGNNRTCTSTPQLQT